MAGDISVAVGKHYKFSLIIGYDQNNKNAESVLIPHFLLKLFIHVEFKYFSQLLLFQIMN